jgi:hypothetical protein
LRRRINETSINTDFTCLEENEMAEKQDFNVELTINGEKVRTNPYVSSVFINVLLGLVKTLKDVEEPGEVVVRISK